MESRLVELIKALDDFLADMEGQVQGNGDALEHVQNLRHDLQADGDNILDAIADAGSAGEGGDA